MKQEIKQRIYRINLGEVPEGYKKTKIGIVPSNWKVMKLIDISINGISNGIFNDPKKIGSGVKLINVVDLYNEPYINKDNLELLNVTDKEFENFKVKKYDMLCYLLVLL